MVTPLDQRQRLEYFENPMIPGQFVSVDLFNKNLKPYNNASIETQQNSIPRCKENHILVFQPLPEEKQHNECDCLPSSKEERSFLKGWSCSDKDCEDKRWRCSNCGTDYYIR